MTKIDILCHFTVTLLSLYCHFMSLYVTFLNSSQFFPSPLLPKFLHFFPCVQCDMALVSCMYLSVACTIAPNAAAMQFRFSAGEL